MDIKVILGRLIILFHQTLNDIKTEKDIEQFKIFWNSFITIYPCKECREHMIKLMDETFKEKLESSKTKEELIQWGIDIHNEINKKLNKPLFPYKQTRTITNYNTKIINKNRISRKMRMSKFKRNQMQMRNMLANSYISRNTTSCSSCG